MDFDSPPETSLDAGPPPAWAGLGPPLMGLFPGLPLHRCAVSDVLGPRGLCSSLGASTPGHPSSCQRWPSASLAGSIRGPSDVLPSAAPCQGYRSFRPRGFSPPRRLSPRLGRGLVASRYRSWGSACLARASFPTSLRTSPPFRQSPGRLPHVERPFGAFPSSAAGPCHHGLLPSCRHRSALAAPTPAGAGHTHRCVFRSFRAGPHARSTRDPPEGSAKALRPCLPAACQRVTRTLCAVSVRSSSRPAA